MILFVIITAVEVMIALFCHGGFVRYYLGDVIVVWAVYCFVQIFLRGRFSSCGICRLSSASTTQFSGRSWP